MKKIRIFTALMPLLFLLAGCSSGQIDEIEWDLAGRFREFVNQLPESEGENRSPEAVARSQEEVILESVLSRDADAIKALLIPSMRTASEVDEQIESFFDFIDGNIMSYSEPRSTSRSASKEGFTITDQHVGAMTADITTDTGRVYTISHSTVTVDSWRPEETGVYYIFIKDADSCAAIGADLFSGASLEDVVGLSLARTFYAYDENWERMSDEELEIWRWAAYNEYPLYMGYDDTAEPVTYHFMTYNDHELFTMTRFGNQNIVAIEIDDGIKTYRVIPNIGDELPGI